MAAVAISTAKGAPQFGDFTATIISEKEVGLRDKEILPFSSELP